MVLVRLYVVSRQGGRQGRVGVVPADEARPLLLELQLDMVPQPRHDVAGAISVDRLVQAQRDVDQGGGPAGLGTLPRVPPQEPEDALTGAAPRRHGPERA